MGALLGILWIMSGIRLILRTFLPTALDHFSPQLAQGEYTRKRVPGMALQLIFWCVAPEVKLSAVTGRKDYTNKATA